MNCRPGDLVVVVNCTGLGGRAHIGKLTTVTGPSMDYLGHWVTKPEFFSSSGRTLHWGDDHLRPIRDNDGEDQTLQWAGHPLQHTAHDVAELHKQVDRLADIARQLVEIQKLL